MAGVLVAATALLALTTGAASAAPAGDAALQQRVDKVLASIPGGTQVSANEVRYDGLTVRFASKSVSALAAIPCGYGHLCFRVNGNTDFDFYTCKTWSLSNWLGSAPYNNNQTVTNGVGTTAKAWDNNSVQRWSSTSKESGTANVNPWYWLKPC
ncbi:hypothetical protein ACFQFC_08480 [Amorphoplanes digitatis]|uniref:Secreted protein n=1 Tax=Actinoplanes digitatis TaxID=1868 RepID=A0A7W7MRG9_9ACTN|nr:hypothetical protein [Actinoplanes digitatis]MBB4764241.1 hypothetical protein [Actinoplanes digitatis]BFE73624.1 hypothetical protein GCM10020092_069250 [Actinoplanes digitatis]